jgi:hypothetical protein
VSIALLAAVINLNKRPYYIHWGVIQLSLANAIVILLMVVVFAIAVIVRLPGSGDAAQIEDERPADGEDRP